MGGEALKELESADQVLGQKNNLAQEWVDVPEWGLRVRVQEMDGTARDAFEASIVNQEGKKVTQDLRNLRAKLVARSLVNKAGALVFSEQHIEDLGHRSSKALDRVFTVAQRVSGLTEKDMKELAGNSEPGQNGASTSV